MSKPRANKDVGEGTAHGFGASPDPSLDLCPVAPLGSSGAHLIFAMPNGEIRREPACRVGQMLNTDIFACKAGQAFLNNWRGPHDNKLLREHAAIWFVQKCRDAGYWDDSRLMRGLGLWPGEGGAIVLHRGDHIEVYAPDGTSKKLTVFEALKEPREPLYRIAPPAPAPAAPSDRTTGQWIGEMLNLWRFEPIGDEGLTGADVALGWIGLAMLGAAAPFRAHLLVFAMAGSGKSTLLTYIHALMSSLAGDIMTSFTEAGLRNELSGKARPVVVDEFEGTGGGIIPGPVELALKVFRQMSTGEGGKRKQGDVGGGTVTQGVVGAALMCAINPPMLDPADASRTVELRLQPLSPAPAGQRPATHEQLVAAIARALELSSALLGRVIAGAGRYRQDIEQLKAAMARAGEQPRTADLVAGLAAGRRLLLHDEPLTPAEAEDELKLLGPLLAQRQASEAVPNPGADCLAHLMSAPSGQRINDRIETLGELIQRSAKGGSIYDHVLPAHGLRVHGTSADGNCWLYVANHHPALTRIFERTSWRDWRKTLAYLDGLGPDYATKIPGSSHNFGPGGKSRCLAIPLSPWLETERRVPQRSAAVPSGGR